MKIELSTIDSEFETENKFVFKIVHAMQMIKSFNIVFLPYQTKQQSGVPFNLHTFLIPLYLCKLK